MRALIVAMLCLFATSVYGEDRPRVDSAAYVSADSVLIAVSWGQVVDARNNPVPTYLVEIRNGATVLASHQTARLADTLMIARPLAGDSIFIVAAVAARDVRGVTGAFGLSSSLKIRGKDWTPPRAPTVGADTLAQVQPDSVKVFPLTLAMDADGTYHTTVGSVIQMCGMAYFDNVGYLNSQCAGSGWLEKRELYKLHVATRFTIVPSVG